MAFLDDEADGGPANSNIGTKVAGVLALVAVGMAVKFFTTGNILGTKEEWTPTRVDSELLANPQAGELYRAIKAAYPDEYRVFVGQMTDHVRSGSGGAVSAQARAFTRNLMVRHFDGIARAPSYQLVEIARQYTLLLGTLQRTDVESCAQLVTGTGDFRPQPNSEAVPVLTRLGVLQIRAAQAGEAQAEAVPRAELSGAEADEVLQQLSRRSAEAGRLITDQRALMAAESAQQCAAGLALYQTVEALPPEMAAKVTVSLLRESFGSRAPVGEAGAQAAGAGR